MLMKTTGLDEDIDRAVPGVCEVRPEWSKCNFAFEFLLEHLTEKIGGFYELVTLIERSDRSGGVGFD